MADAQQRGMGRGLAAILPRSDKVEDGLRETVECVRRFGARAAAHGASQLDVVVTAPGRRAANADELVEHRDAEMLPRP